MKKVYIVTYPEGKQIACANENCLLILLSQLLNDKSYQNLREDLKTIAPKPFTKKTYTTFKKEIDGFKIESLPLLHQTRFIL